MEKREVGRKYSRTVPVIVENHENATKKTKLMVPSNYTAGHLANVLRSRMHLLPYHPLYLFLKSKQSPVLMSKSIGHLHQKHRDEKGLLRLIHAEQASFGFRGNIRAIRFRQKWIENLHDTMLQDAGGSPQYSGAPPPYFPVEPPTAGNFGAPPDVDDISDALVQLTESDDYYDYMANSFMMEIEDMYMPNDWPDQPANTAISSQSSALTNSSQSSVSPALADWALSSSLSDPWLPTAATNSGQTSGASSSFVLLNTEEDMNHYNLELNQYAQELAEASANGLPVSHLPIVSVNLQPAIVQFPQAPTAQNPHVPTDLSLYESDSDFYDSDKDVGMNE